MKDSDKQARLAAALRENLRKRKAASAAPKIETPTSPSDTDEPK